MPRFTSDDVYPLLVTMQATMHANQLAIMNILRTVLQKENAMAVDLTALTAEVANNSSVTGSVLALVQNLVTQIQNIPPSTDPVTQAALDALVSTLSANDGTIASAVAANTPAAAAAARKV